jgi:uncharacterized glyoxalase superfamily protein PhnB
MPEQSTPVPDAFYPVLMVANVAAARRCYVDLFDFEAVYDSGWYVSLVHQARPDLQLAFVARDHDSVPPDHRRQATGLLLNWEVADASAEWERLRECGLEVALTLRDEPFGQRHFMLVDPNGLLIDVIEYIPAAPEFAAGYLR